MSAFTDRLYRTWVTSHASPGYGAKPHVSEAKRRGGIPDRPTHDQVLQRMKKGPCGLAAGCAATSRTGAQCATDATSRPEKPVFKSLPNAVFLPGTEKSSIKSTD